MIMRRLSRKGIRFASVKALGDVLRRFSKPDGRERGGGLRTKIENSQMDNKLFVGNLAWATTEDDLRAYFGQFGTVESVEVLRDKFTGRARGFAFVIMATAEDAQKAIENTEGREFQGRPLKVNVARPREDKPPQRGNGGFRPRFGGNAPRGGFGGGRGGFSKGPRRGFGGPRRNGGTRSFEGGEER